jgi:hypothetical protein
MATATIIIPGQGAIVDTENEVTIIIPGRGAFSFREAGVGGKRYALFRKG